MLSRTEIKFLKEPEAFNSEYARILRFRIKRKISKLKEILGLLMESEFSNEIASLITENCNTLQNSVTPETGTEKPILSPILQNGVKFLVGSPGFEPGSREPKSRSLDQASPRPLLRFFLKYFWFKNVTF